MTKKIEGMATVEEDENGRVKVVFAPGAFDHFDGTQEELDAAIAQIEAMIESGELLESGQELTEEDWDELPDEIKESISNALAAEANPRTLQ